MNNITNIKQKFTETYSNFKWKYGHGESKSGEGSSLEWTENYRQELLKIIQEYNITKILDCSCGDWNWMKTISDKLVDYTGIDIVDDLIEENNKKFGSDKIKFYSTDMFNFVNNTNEFYDLVICRHTFEHLPNEYVIKTIESIIKKTKYCLFSSQEVVQNSEIEFDGYKSRNINLNLSPFKDLLGNPVYSFVDSPFANNNLIYNNVFGNLYKIEK